MPSEFSTDELADTHTRALEEDAGMLLVVVLSAKATPPTASKPLSAKRVMVFAARRIYLPVFTFMQKVYGPCHERAMNGKRIPIPISEISNTRQQISRQC
ncbi:MAG TPA: hypothetical protein VG753_02050 [Candidatus Paceibacterota bacterium]|nr:hypothetical protein [Candidatus Paceibacterota bacterium]